MRPHCILLLAFALVFATSNAVLVDTHEADHSLTTVNSDRNTKRSLRTVDRVKDGEDDDYDEARLFSKLLTKKRLAKELKSLKAAEKANAFYRNGPVKQVVYTTERRNELMTDLLALNKSPDFVYGLFKLKALGAKATESPHFAFFKRYEEALNLKNGVKAA
ncbi:hypothetical protein PHYBOEH_010624 [Phytophthora boehmeriae]|uniref:RxLR effector protein n=1 Tax=Phytophthora boehmeriae TaxID=109152 RepID=A0A8T1VL76_9STRA|nr:hypothetical protein PHYBOEH_010624 [Phytophthora boehmeriae]